MKFRELFFSLLFLCALPAYTQYQPIAIEGANWVVYYSVKSASDNYTNHHIIKIKGDTIVNDLAYKKIYKQKIDSDAYCLSDFTPPYVTTTNELIGFIRDDIATEQVYMIPVNSIVLCQEEGENLLYDFSSQEGDNLNGCLLDPFFTIDSIGQEVVWGKTGKCFLRLMMPTSL